MRKRRIFMVAGAIVLALCGIMVSTCDKKSTSPGFGSEEYIWEDWNVSTNKIEMSEL